MEHDPWLPIEIAPFGREVALAVLEDGQAHALVFACRRARNGWVRARSGEPVYIEPTHWREWVGNGSQCVYPDDCADGSGKREHTANA